MRHLQRVQTGYPPEVDPNMPEDQRKRYTERLTRLTTVVQRTGVYKMVDIVSVEDRVALAAWANDYESRRTRGINLVYESVGKRR